MDGVESTDPSRYLAERTHARQCGCRCSRGPQLWSKLAVRHRAALNSALYFQWRPSRARHGPRAGGRVRRSRPGSWARVPAARGGWLGAIEVDDAIRAGRLRLAPFRWGLRNRRRDVGAVFRFPLASQLFWRLGKLVRPAGFEPTTPGLGIL